MAMLTDSLTVGNPFVTQFLSLLKSSQNDGKSETDPDAPEIKGRLN